MKVFLTIALYREAQKRLDRSDSVILQSRIMKIKRTYDGVRVGAKTPDGNVVVKAKKLVVAIPPTLEKLEDIGLDLTPEEKGLFDKFQSFL